MNMPGFNAEATMESNSKNYRITTRASNNQRIITRSRLTCGFKAGRLAGRCLAAGYDHGDCMELATDFNAFCNSHDL